MRPTTQYIKYIINLRRLALHLKIIGYPDIFQRRYDYEKAQWYKIPSTSQLWVHAVTWQLRGIRNDDYKNLPKNALKCSNGK